MSTESEQIAEVWHTLQEYIPAKEKQIAADHLISAIIDFDFPHSDFVALVNSDEHLKEAALDYLDAEEEDADYDEEMAEW